MLDLLTTATMNGNSFVFTSESGNLDTAAETAELAMKPAGDIVLTDVTVYARTIAAYHKMARQQLADVPQLGTTINTRLVYSVNRRVESQVLNGDGVGENLLGILRTSGIATSASNPGDTVNADLVLGGINAVLDSSAVPTATVMHPNDKIRRADPAAVQHARGGREPLADFMLRRLVWCRECGQPAYSIVHQADVETWIAERIAERADEQGALHSVVDAKRRDLVTLDAQRDKRMAELAEIGITAIGMEVIERIDEQRFSRRREIEDAEAQVSEWTGALSADAVLDWYGRMRDLVTGRVARARASPRSTPPSTTACWACGSPTTARR